VHHHHGQIRLKLGQRGFQSDCLAPGAERERLGHAAVEEEWTFVRPEAAAVAADTSKANPDAKIKDRGFGIEKNYPRRFQDAAKLGAAQTAPVVITEDRHNRKRDRPEQTSRELDLWDPAAVGNIASDHEHISALVQSGQLIGQTRWDLTAHVEIANRRDAYRQPSAFQLQV